VFQSLSWTQAQKRDLRQYRPGQVLHFHRSQGGFGSGELGEVVAVNAASLSIRRTDGSRTEFKVSRAGMAFDVGEARDLKITAGDKLLLQANAGGKGFINGELVEVKEVDGGAILLTDGRVLPEGYRSFTYGYALTSHAAQGKTVDEVLVVASSRSLPAVHQQQLYVSISRGRESCHLFTDDKQLLRAHVGRSSTRVAAVEAIQPKAPRHLISRLLGWAATVANLVRLNARSQTHKQVQSQNPFSHQTRIKHHANTLRIS
jgi:hypothetical protein